MNSGIVFSSDLSLIIALKPHDFIAMSTILVVVALALIMTSYLTDDRFFDEAFVMQSQYEFRDYNSFYSRLQPHQIRADGAL